MPRGDIQYIASWSSCPDLDQTGADEGTVGDAETGQSTAGGTK